MNYNRPDLSHGDSADSVKHTRRSTRTATAAKKGRRWLFLVVDILLLAAILAAVFFLIVLLTPLDPFSGNDREQCSVLYTLELSGVDRASLEALNKGDRVTDAGTGSVIGEVVDVENRPYAFYTDIPTQYNDKYVVSKETSADKYTITVTVRADATYEKGVGYSIEDCRIAVGRSFELHFPGYAGHATCVTFVKE